MISSFLRSASLALLFAYTLGPRPCAAQNQRTQSNTQGPQSAPEPKKELKPKNPYHSGFIPTRPTLPTHEAPLEKSEPTKKGTFEDTPATSAGDTGHVIPTQGWTESSETKEPPPFSVGGITAQANEDTWFKFYGFIQTRYVSGQHKNAEERTSGGGFSLARARLFYYGRLTDWLRVLIRVGATADGTARFEQAFADFRYRDFTFRVGQFYLPVFQEQSLSPITLQGLNFSAVGSVFDGGQTQGARATWDLKPTRLHFFLTDGWRTGFSEAGAAKVADIAISTRVETILGSRNYGQFDTGSSFRGEKLAVLLGGGLHYQSGGELREDAVELASLNLDLTVEADGLSLHGSASIMDTETTAGTRVYNYGFVGQGGVFILKWTELFARYEAVITTESSQNPQSIFRGLSAGINHFVWPSRGIRVVGDFVYYLDPTVGTAITPDPNAGLFHSFGSQWSARTQFNVLF